MDPINWTTENYWTISLHSPTGGSIREIYTIETQQDHLLVCCGQDGGIFAHKVNLSQHKADLSLHYLR